MNIFLFYVVDMCDGSLGSLIGLNFVEGSLKLPEALSQAKIIKCPKGLLAS